MWIILEHMNGHNQKYIHIYQLMKVVYSLQQGEKTVAGYHSDETQHYSADSHEQQAYLNQVDIQKEDTLEVLNLNCALVVQGGKRNQF